MVKKESAKRGYMTPQEVEAHLKGIGTSNAKITYLRDMINHKLSPKTRDAVYENLAEQYSKIGNYERVEDSLVKRGDYKNAAIAALKNPEVTDFHILTLLHNDRQIKFNDIMAADFLAEISKDWKKYFGEKNGSAANRAEDMALEIYKKEGRHHREVAELELKIAENRGPDSEEGRHLLYNAYERYEILGDNKTAEALLKKYIKLLKERKINTEVAEERLEELRKKKSDLTSRLSSVIAIAGVLGGLFFLSTNITGNAIANVSQSSGNILGAVLLVIGLVAGFFWVKKK